MDNILKIINVYTLITEELYNKYPNSINNIIRHIKAIKYDEKFDDNIKKQNKKIEEIITSLERVKDMIEHKRKEEEKQKKQQEEEEKREKDEEEKKRNSYIERNKLTAYLIPYDEIINLKEASEGELNATNLFSKDKYKILIILFYKIIYFIDKIIENKQIENKQIKNKINNCLEKINNQYKKTYNIKNILIFLKPKINKEIIDTIDKIILPTLLEYNFNLCDIITNMIYFFIIETTENLVTRYNNIVKKLKELIQYNP